MDETTTTNVPQAIAHPEFGALVAALNGVPGWWCAVEWDLPETDHTTNRVWVTGPYHEREAAERDSAFFRSNGAPFYGRRVRRSAVCGKDGDA